MAILLVTAKGTSLRIVTHLLIVLLFLTSLINIVYLGSHLFSLHPTIPNETQRRASILLPTTRSTSSADPATRNAVRSGVSGRINPFNNNDALLQNSVTDNQGGLNLMKSLLHIQGTDRHKRASTNSSSAEDADTATTTTTRVVRDDTIKIEDSSSEYDPYLDLDDRFSSGHDEVPEQSEDSAEDAGSNGNGNISKNATVVDGVGGPLAAPIKSAMAGDLQQLRRMDHDDDENSQGDDNSKKESNQQKSRPQHLPQEANVADVVDVETARKEEEKTLEGALSEQRNDEPPKSDSEQEAAKPDDEVEGSDEDDGGEEEEQEGEERNAVDDEEEGKIEQDALSDKDENTSKGKQPIFDLLETAGIRRSDLDAATIQQLPTWEQVTSLYYPQTATPVIYGLETCETYRRTVAVDHQFFGIAGLFNTGTNALDWALAHNIEHRNTRWQVPWGKHRLAKVKWTHTVQDDWDLYNKTNVLPIVIIKDPFTWMQSMCHSSYSAMWRHSKAHCPNLVPTDDERQLYPQLRYRDSIPVKIDFDANSTEHWDSLVHLWNDWYMQYYNADYPRLVVRFEDLLFLPEQLLEQIARCVGTDVKHPVQHKAKTSKEHGSNTDLVHAIINYGNAQRTRVANMTIEDLHFADQTIDATLRTFFQYRLSQPPSQPAAITTSIQ